MTDPSPELRTSLRDLLFKDGDFRWNRLENLLRNASNSDDYNISKVLDQALNFLLSERGDFIRVHLVEELINNLDLASRNTFINVRTKVGEWLGMKLEKTAVTTSRNTVEEKRVEHIKNIWQIIQNTPGFDPMQLVQLVPNILGKPEMQKMGQQVAGGLTQRMIARLIRQLLLYPEYSNINGQKSKTQPQLSLPIYFR